MRGFRQGLWGGALGGSVGTAMTWWWQNVAQSGASSAYSATSAILARTTLGSGAWTNIIFSNVPSAPGPIGLRGPRQSLLYLVARDASFPAGATNTALPLQHSQAVTLLRWPDGKYVAQWYDPATAALVGQCQAMTTNAVLVLPLPDFTEDLAGVVAPEPPLPRGPRSKITSFGGYTRPSSSSKNNP